MRVGLPHSVGAIVGALLVVTMEGHADPVVIRAARAAVARMVLHPDAEPLRGRAQEALGVLLDNPAGGEPAVSALIAEIRRLYEAQISEGDIEPAE